MLRSFSFETDKLVEVPCPHPEEPGPRVVWFDMYEPEKDEVSRVEENLALEMPTRAEMAEIELSDRLYAENGATFITLTALTSLDDNTALKTPLTFVIKGDQLVTLRYADPKPIRSFVIRARRAGTLNSATGEQVMLGIIEALIDRTADALERVGDDIDGISHEVFRARPSSQEKRDLEAIVEQVGRKGDLLTKIQESLVSVSRAMAYWAAIEPLSKKVNKDARQRLKLIQRDANQLGEHANFLNSKVNFLLEATMGLINLEQNQIMKIFSVASVMMLPPTLIGAVYGMNFRFMPELDWPYGYPMALGLMLLSAVLPFLYFKRKHWL